MLLTCGRSSLPMTSCASIRKSGINTPLEISDDGYIISGHRRHTAAKLAGLESVPCRIAPITHDDPRFVPLLCECNRQRVKGFEELLREAVVTVNPEQAYAEVRKLRPPEPYKGKGIRYAGEQVRRKAGKTGAK